MSTPRPGLGKKPPPPPPKKTINATNSNTTAFGLAVKPTPSTESAVDNNQNTALSPRSSSSQEQTIAILSSSKEDGVVEVEIQEDVTSGVEQNGANEQLNESQQGAQEAQEEQPEGSPAEAPAESQNGAIEGTDLIATRVGRAYQQQGVNYIIDEAEWESIVTKTAAISTFPVVVKKDEAGKDQLSIMSTYLQKVFREVVHYFPEVVVENKIISMSEPYAPLYFYMPEIIKYIESDESDGAEREDIRPLIYFYEKWVKVNHQGVRDTLAGGMITFSTLWALFQPGTLLYTLDEFGQPVLFRIAASEYRGQSQQNQMDLGDVFPKMFNTGTVQQRFVLDAWKMDWDGSTRTFSRSTKTMAIVAFTGTRPVTSLEIYPLRNYKGGDEEQITQLIKSMEDRGRQWRDLIVDPPSCWYHSGPAQEMQSGMLKAIYKDKTSLVDRVIVDHDGFGIYMVNQMADLMGPVAQLMSLMTATREVPVQSGGFDDFYREFDNIPANTELTKEQLELCPSSLHCCVLSNMRWYKVSISNLSPVDWRRSAFKHLVLDSSIKDMLQGLVEQHKRSKALGRIMSDVIPSKGQGLVIVLHGPPGVGKTLTAESVAEYTQKPLYPVNIGELTMENLVVNKLEEVFLKAARWDAVLLLDEADVVLEKRSYEDVKRNGIVSVFLRMLEYYRGILFMTTNRLGTMDVAFQSRISIAIRYRALDPPLRRQIWENFIELLDNSEADGKEELRRNLDDMQEWELNGRQIRNALTIAQSIAFAQGRRKGALRFEHVEKVVSETLNFQDYFEDAYRESRARLGEMSDKQFREKKAKQLM